MAGESQLETYLVNGTRIKVDVLLKLRIFPWNDKGLCHKETQYKNELKEMYIEAAST